MTSCCCPVWIAMIRKIYSELVPHVPGAVSPMIAAGRVVKELYPQVEGVAVCIKGNFDSEIKNNIISIIQALFDIESHKISVSEMK